MVAKLDPSVPGSLDLLSTWAGCESLSACSHPSSPSAVPRYTASDLSIRALFKSCGCPELLYQDDDFQEETDTTSTLSESTADGAVFTFTASPTTVVPFIFLHRPESLPRIAKRIRHRLDVEGPNTAALSCKKRRLRNELITSRLSQPYSQPATHILNREGMKSGDKRFLKMATSLDDARRIAHLHATSFLRYALMNRLRKKLGLGRPGQSYDESEQEKNRRGGIDTSANAQWRPQAIEASSGGKYIRPSTPSNGMAASTPSKSQTCRLSVPTALPLPPSDKVAAKRLPSSRIHPIQSPEMRPDHAAYDELDDDGFAFAHLDDEGAGEEGVDGDQVYSDFSVIFGGGASDDDHSYEEYLDELDGISWATM